MAAGRLDSLARNGAIITLLSTCNLTRRESYADILVVAVLAPLISLAALIIPGTLFGSF